MTKIAVIADIHSNLEAFKAVLDSIKKRGIKEIYCTGDIIGYGASPNECINLARKMKIKCVAGNHDFYVIAADDISWFTPAGQDALRWTHKKLTKANMNFLKKLPATRIEKGIYFVHGSPRDPLHEYIFPESDDWELKKFFGMAKKSRMLALGHSHIPFEKKVNGYLVFNPGSVGQPRDCDPRASYCILDTQTKKIEFCRVAYDISKAAEKIIKAKLPKSLAERLYLGR
ncbi:metallophosphoesterase family protein [Candidatus Woesearchaeota archaeon]|nr:metallophosphoesterase family protein [Candidatus Woesearchaeota archaeon]